VGWWLVDGGVGGEEVQEAMRGELNGMVDVKAKAQHGEGKHSR